MSSFTFFLLKTKFTSNIKTKSAVKILVVDDNTNMRKTIKSFVAFGDNQLFEAADGKEAIEIYSKILPDWVLMDIKMKNLNGFEATRQIKLSFPDAHIAIVTNYDTKYYKKSAQKAGADLFISKQNLVDLRKILEENERLSFASD